MCIVGAFCGGRWIDEGIPVGVCLGREGLWLVGQNARSCSNCQVKLGK